MDWLLLSTPLLPLAWSCLLLREIQVVQRLRMTGAKAMGQIVRQRRALGRYNVVQFVPVAKFRTVRGQVIEAESASISTQLTLPTGTYIALYYEPDSPTRFMFTQELTGGNRYLLMAVALLVAVAFGLLAWL